jgi:hypothetical protein
VQRDAKDRGADDSFRMVLLLREKAIGKSSELAFTF